MSNEAATKVYGKWITIDSIVYDASGAVIVDLTDNEITELSEVKDLLGFDNSEVRVTVSAVFNSDLEISVLYIVSAEVEVNYATNWWHVAMDDEDVETVSYTDGLVTKTATLNRASKFEADRDIEDIEVSTVSGYIFTGYEAE